MADAYRLSPLAVEDLEQIYLYTLKTWSPRQADRYLGDIIDTFEALACGVKTGREVDIVEGYLKLPVGSHVVFYRPRSDGIDIIRILHQAMDIERHLKG